MYRAYVRQPGRATERLKKDYWLYVVFDCASTPKLHTVQDPARLGWRPIVNIEHYTVHSADILHADVAQRRS
jgi:nanoRNase/pAp phosphatase (c-di-AMP/oligoRNAs hydrolase)